LSDSDQYAAIRFINISGKQQTIRAGSCLGNASPGCVAINKDDWQARITATPGECEDIPLLPPVVGLPSNISTYINGRPTSTHRPAAYSSNLVNQNRPAAEDRTGGWNADNYPGPGAPDRCPVAPSIKSVKSAGWLASRVAGPPTHDRPAAGLNAHNIPACGKVDRQPMALPLILQTRYVTVSPHMLIAPIMNHSVPH